MKSWLSFDNILGVNEIPNLKKQKTKHDDYYKLQCFYYNHQNNIFAIVFIIGIVVFSISIIAMSISLNTCNVEWII